MLAGYLKSTEWLIDQMGSAAVAVLGKTEHPISLKYLAEMKDYYLGKEDGHAIGYPFFTAKFNNAPYSMIVYCCAEDNVLWAAPSFVQEGCKREYTRIEVPADMFETYNRMYAEEVGSVQGTRMQEIAKLRKQPFYSSKHPDSGKNKERDDADSDRFHALQESLAIDAMTSLNAGDKVQFEFKLKEPLRKGKFLRLKTKTRHYMGETAYINVAVVDGGDGYNYEVGLDSLEAI